MSLRQISTLQNGKAWGFPRSTTQARLQKLRCSTTTQTTETVQLKAEVLSSINQVKQEEWDALVSSCEEYNPFLSWSFLHTLEASNSAVTHKGWGPQHIAVRDQEGTLVGAVLLYIKSHSYGEYVFDSSWASYCQALGQQYYPKLQSCVPFTPVTGRRLLTRNVPWKTAVVQALGKALIAIADTLNLSSIHITFNTAEEWAALAELGFLQRTGIQFHWDNRDYRDFEHFLADLKQSKRKSIRQERKSIQKQGLSLRRLTGRELTPSHWDTFYSFYLDTVDRKWGSAYLTRDFFHMLGEAMPDQVLLAVAEEDDEIVAGALNLVGSHAIYGRNWGVQSGREYKNLHFELCYYQALEEAIARRLPRVEAGAQGEHKLQRGYLPSLTYSSHFIRDPTFRSVVERVLDRERKQMEGALLGMTLQESPFKQHTTADALSDKLGAYVTYAMAGRSYDGNIGSSSKGSSSGDSDSEPDNSAFETNDEL